MQPQITIKTPAIFSNAGYIRKPCNNKLISNTGYAQNPCDVKTIVSTGYASNPCVLELHNDYCVTSVSTGYTSNSCVFELSIISPVTGYFLNPCVTTGYDINLCDLSLHKISISLCSNHPIITKDFSRILSKHLHHGIRGFQNL